MCATASGVRRLGVAALTKAKLLQADTCCGTSFRHRGNDDHASAAARVHSFGVLRDINPHITTPRQWCLQRVVNRHATRPHPDGHGADSDLAWKTVSSSLGPPHLLRPPPLPTHDQTLTWGRRWGASLLSAPHTPANGTQGGLGDVPWLDDRCRCGVNSARVLFFTRRGFGRHQSRQEGAW